MTIAIDLNADLGENDDPPASGVDYELMRCITSVNIACGGHAGNEGTMRRTLAAARELGVAAGAHPGHPDREHFGRRPLSLSPAEIERSVAEQIAALARVAGELGIKLTHVKPHGALYHAASLDADIALAIGRAAKDIDPLLVMIGQAGSSALEVWRSVGLRSAAEAFADRYYEPDGSLRKRTLPRALIDDPALAGKQAVDIAIRHRVIAHDDSNISVAADTICIHSDTPGSAAIAREVAHQLKAAGARLQSLASVYEG